LVTDSKQRYFMQEALKEADLALQRGELPIGAILVMGDEIIARDSTRDKELKERIVHAEILALLQLDKIPHLLSSRREIHLYTNLEPCMMCMGACLVSDISKVYYALESPTDGVADFYNSWHKNPANHVGCRRVEVVGGLLREQSQELFRIFCERFPTGGYSSWAKTLLKR
jgi:tRNA(adenine34) deaminase